MVEDFLYHESNIDGKCRDLRSNRYRGIFRECIEYKREKYLPYKEGQLRISGISQNDIEEKITLLKQYYISVNEFQQTHHITSQSKFRPSILEEFCGFLFKDIPKVRSLNLGFFNKDVFAGLGINSQGKAIIRTKNIDFCIGKHFGVTFESQSEKLIIPVIAIECKTYTDKTMLNEAQFTAQKLKQGSPSTKVYILSEGNQVANDEIPLKGQTPLDQIFILRPFLGRDGTKKIYGEINSEVVHNFFTQIVNDLDTIIAEKQIPDIGAIMPE
jgi:hypothetical protein